MPRKEQDIAIDKLKKMAISDYNINLIRTTTDESPDLIREYNKQGEVKQCGQCLGFFGESTIWKHTRHCHQRHSPIKQNYSVHQLKHQSNDSFTLTILDKFRIGETGDLCRSDEMLKIIGLQLWEKSAKKDKKKIMTDMRELAKLVLECRKTSKKSDFDTSDIFKVKHFHFVFQALKDRTTGEADKDSLRVRLSHILKSAALVVSSEYIILGKMAESQDAENFTKVINQRWGSLVNNSVLKMKKRSSEKLRMPSELPREEDMATLKQYTKKAIADLMENDKWDGHSFNRLRSLLVCRLTVYNARRSGEPARMTLEEWDKAESGAYLDPQRRALLDEQQLADCENHKVGFIEGKNQPHVPILFPTHCIEPLEKIVAIRNIAGINRKNIYLFPAGHLSTNHIEGNQAVAEICKAAGIKTTATKIRHRAATRHAEQRNIPEDERTAMYEHLSHSKEINKNVYQTPRAQQALRLGPFFRHLDGSDDEATGKKPIT